jgi:uncharacterized protein (DUF362 family)
MMPLARGKPSASEARRPFVKWFDASVLDGSRLADELVVSLDGADAWQARTVYVKPNFTAPVYRQGVTTSPEVLRALIDALCRLGARPVIVESDGSLESWTAEQAFEGHGVRQMERQFGIPAINLTAEATVRTTLPGRHGRPIHIELPRRLMDEPGILFSVPVLKAHAFTTVTLGLKNLWGCIPSPRRLLYHARLPEVLSGILGLWGPGWSLIDGTWAMDGFGPIYGDVFRQNVLLLSSPLLAGDLLGSRFMGIDVRSVAHLRYALEAHTLPSLTQNFAENLPKVVCRRFQPRGDLLQRVAQVVFHSRMLTQLVYLSPLATVKNRLVHIARRARD